MMHRSIYNSDILLFHSHVEKKNASGKAITFLSEMD